MFIEFVLLALRIIVVVLVMLCFAPCKYWGNRCLSYIVMTTHTIEEVDITLDHYLVEQTLYIAGHKPETVRVQKRDSLFG